MWNSCMSIVVITCAFETAELNKIKRQKLAEKIDNGKK